MSLSLGILIRLRQVPQHWKPILLPRISAVVISKIKIVCWATDQIWLVIPASLYLISEFYKGTYISSPGNPIDGGFIEVV